MAEPQQPGQVYSPGTDEQQNQNNASVGNQPTGSGQQNSTNEEIAAIDNAVKNVPPAAATNEVPTTPEQSEDSDPAPQSPATEENTAPSQQQSADNTQEQQANQDTESGGPLLTWEAAEPVEASSQNAKSLLALTGAAVVVIGVVVILGGINFSTITSILVIILAVIAVVVSSRQHNHMESYAIYDDGIKIGDRFYGFAQLRAFSIVPHGSAASVEFDPTQRFMVRRVMHLENGTAEQAIDLLSQRLPYEERSQGMVDQLTNKFKL